MKYEATLTELRAMQARGVLWVTLEELARRFEASVSTLHYWRTHAEFPKPAPHTDGHTRLDTVIAWLDARIALEAQCVLLAPAAARVGRSVATFRRLVREKKLPAPACRQLGSKAELWRLADLDEATGGAPLPPPRHRPSSQVTASHADSLLTVERSRDALTRVRQAILAQHCITGARYVLDCAVFLPVLS